MTPEQRRASTALGLAWHDELSLVQVSREGNLNVYLHGDFEFWWQDAVVLPIIEHLPKLARLSDPVITVNVSSRGGYVMVCWDIVDTLERAKNAGVTVRTVVTSHAWSCGSVVAVSGTEGERYIGRRATHLVHYGSDGATWETPLQVERAAGWSKHDFELLVSHYQEHCKIPQLRRQIADDGLWFGAEDCVRYGLADAYTEDL